MWYTNQRVTSLELRVYCISCELQVSFIARVSYFLHTSCELLFIARVTSYCLLHELRVIIYCTSYKLLLLHELRVIVYCTSYGLLFVAPVTSYFLHTSYELLKLRVAQVTSYFLITIKLKMIKLFVITRYDK